jgi:hypothetical protein
LYYVLKKVSVPLYDKVWETRVASSLAISSIACFQKKYQPVFEGKEEEPLKEEYFSFQTFNLDLVIKNEKRLLAAKVEKKKESKEITLEEGETKKTKRKTEEMIMEEFIEQETNLSTRQMNRKKASEKRKQTPEENFSSDTSEPPEKKFKTIVTDQPQNDDKFVMETVQEEFEYKKWPFESICKQFKKDLFSDEWGKENQLKF